MTEEDIILEQSMEIPTVAARGAGNQEGGEETCPVCTEVFSQVYRQEGEEEGSWQLHNAMRDDLGVAYHPECYKDKEAQEKRALENPRDSTPEHDESMEVEDEVKVDLGELKMEVQEGNVEVKTEPLEQSQDEDVEMIEVKSEPGAEVKTEVVDDLMPKPEGVEPVDSESEPMKSGEEPLESGVESAGAGAELSKTEAEAGGAETKPEKVDLDLSMSSNLENKPPVPVSIPKPKVVQSNQSISSSSSSVSSCVYCNTILYICIFIIHNTQLVILKGNLNFFSFSLFLSWDTSYYLLSLCPIVE